MRTRVFLPILLLPLSVACSAILGDFTVGNGDGGGDASDSGGGDVQGNDVIADAPSDAPVLFRLTCGEASKARFQLTNNLALHVDRMRMATLPSGDLRIVLADYPPADGGSSTAVLQSFTIDPQNLQAGATKSPFTVGSNVRSIARYGGPKPGFAAIYDQYDQTLQQYFLWAVRLDDDGETWSTPVELAQIPVGASNEEASFVVVDPSIESYFVVMSTVDATQQTIVGGTVTGGGSALLPSIATFPVQKANRDVYDFNEPMIAIRGPQAFLMLSPSGTNGPPPVGTPALMLVPGQPSITITPPSNLNYFPVAFAGAVDPLKVNAAFLIADLNTLTGTYNVGQVPASGLGTFNPQTLPATVPPISSDAGAFSLTDLFVSASTQHWEMVNATEQFLVVAPTGDPVKQQLLGGVNLAWWDGPTGAVRAYVAGSNRLLSDVPFIITSDVNVQTLVGSIATLSLAYTSAASAPNGGGFPPPAVDLWIAGIACQK